jgi:hypothetical protein
MAKVNRELGLTEEEPPEPTSERVSVWQRRIEYAREHSGTWFSITAPSASGGHNLSTTLRALIRKRREEGEESELWERRVFGAKLYFRHVGEASSE